DLRAVLPDVLDLLHGQALGRGLGALLGRPPRDPLPARRLPALLSVVPGAPARRPPGLGRPRALPARARPRGSGGGEPVLLRHRTGDERALGDQRGHRPREAALLRRALHAVVPRAPRLLPP